MSAKPLEWYEATDHPQDMDENSMLVAHGIGGRYHISHRQQIDREGTMGHLLWLARDEFIWQPYLTVEQAQAAAETDWQEAFKALQLGKKG